MYTTSFIYFSLIMLINCELQVEDPKNYFGIRVQNCAGAILTSWEAQEVLIFYFEDEEYPVSLVKLITVPMIIINMQYNFKLSKYLQVDFYLAWLDSPAKLESLLERIRSKFHPGTKFIIMYNGDSDVGEIFEICLRFRIVNVVIIRGEHILTYFPFKNGACGDWNRPEVIHKCGNDSYDLFPEKVPLDLNGCPIRLLALNIPPYVIDNGNDFNKTGLEVDIVAEISTRMNLTPQYISHDFQSFGYKYHDSRYSGLYLSMLQGKGDLLFGNLRMNISYTEDFSFTTPGHVMDQVTWHVATPDETDRWRNLIQIFTQTLWLALLATTLLNALTWLTLSRRKDKYTSPILCLIYTIYCLLQGSIRKPVSLPLRLAFTSWVIGSLLIVTAYQSKLISFFTRTSYEKQIESVEEMIDKGLKYGFYDSLKELFNDIASPIDYKIYKTYTRCPLTELTCINLTADSKNFGVLKSRRMIRFLTPKIYLHPDGRPKLYSFDVDVFYYPLTMMVLKGNPLLNRITSLTLRMQENGLISWFDTQIAEYIEPNHNKPETPLALEHLMGIFIVYAIGNAFAVVSFVCECTLKRIIMLKCVRNLYFSWRHNKT